MARSPLPAAYPGPGPFAVLIGGAPATGKSTLATALAPRIRAAVVDLDVATGPLTEVVSRLVGPADLADPRMAELTRTPRYDTLFALAGDILRVGLPVVLVAPFTAERSPAGWKSAEQKLSPYAVGLTLVWLHLPADRLIGRLRQRGAPRDIDKIQHPRAYLATVDRRPPTVPHLTLDGALPVSELVERVISELARRGLAIDGNA